MTPPMPGADREVYTAALAGTAKAGCLGAGVRTHMRSMVTGTARHGLQCSVDAVTELLGPQHGL